MTGECIEMLAMNRNFYRSIALTESFGTDVEAGEIELTENSGDKDSYYFTAEIKMSSGELAATVSGIISMEKDEEEWKASRIALTMKDTNN